MIPAMSPRTRMSITTIRPVLDPWAIHKGILGSPRPTHLHHHHRGPQRQLTPVLPPTSRTRCSPLLSALMPSGTRPRSTESSSHRTWRRSVLICVRVSQSDHYSAAIAVPPGPACSYSRIPPAATATTAVTRRSPGELSSPSSVLLFPVRTLDIFFLGGGGGGGGGGWG